MPETRGRTFDEVARDLAFGNIVVGKRTARLEDRNMVVFTKESEVSDNEIRSGSATQATTIPLLGGQNEIASAEIE
ncbi:unnamed protein product [Protopolystoma xenopodis]|uniref:Uncharacterized protein n=1 Tax=Protopolystoma xenopodis TaxID=117903 RepID=A0A448WQB8_9PLAT|nr:unnamed protein product [Protopolystoma xenopodis]